MKKILVVDDDINICELILLYLKKEGYDVILAYDGQKALEIIKKELPDLVVLDIMLPGIDGYDVCCEMKKYINIPTIILSAKGDTFDKVLGLKLGADDYMVKPFDPRELVARIDAVLRRTNSIDKKGNYIELPHLNIDRDKYIVVIQNKTIQLPKKEMELLYFLVKNKGKVFTREQLIDYIWGIDFFGDTRTIDVHIKRIREKLEPIKHLYNIKTIWGVGYKFQILG